VALSEYDIWNILDSLLYEVAILGEDFCIIAANRHYAEAHEMDLQQIRGKHCYELAQGLKHPCQHSNQLCPITLAFKIGKSVTAEHVYQKGDDVKHVEIQAIPLRDPDGQVTKVMEILHNITASKRVQDELQRTLHGADQIFQVGDYGILHLDRDNRIESSNQIAAEIIGYSRQELVGKDFALFIGENDRELFINKNLTPFSDENWPLWIDMVLIKADGSKHSCEFCFWNQSTGNGEIKSVVYIRDLIVGRRIENKLIKAYWMLSNLIDISTDGVIAADMKGDVVIFNQCAEHLLGYTAEEVIGKVNIRQFYFPGVAYEIMQKLRSDKYGGVGRLLPQQITCIAKSGENIPVLLSGALVYQNEREIASVGIFYDLRENLQTQRELQESETKFRNLFETIQHGAFFSSREGKFLDCNQAFVNILGYDTKEELLAIDITRDLYVENDKRIKFVKLVDEFSDIKDFEVKFIKKNGEHITVLMTAHGLKDRNGKISGYQGLVNDVTESRKLAQQLMQAEKMANLGMLAAGVAHEINNPLGGIYMYAHLLCEKTEPDDPRRNFIEKIVRESARCKDIVQGLLKFSRQTEPHFLPTSINSVLKNVMSLFKEQALFQNIRINMNLDPHLPYVIADAPQLEQVFANIIFNAAEAMNGEGLLIITTNISEDGQYVQATIADNGPGIPDKILSHIFEPFFTTKDPTSKESGTGLGLAISYGIIQKHKGTISVSTEIGKGTSFIISLPIEVARA